MRMYDIIQKKKNNLELTAEEIEFAVDGYTNGNIPDYQMSALLMAICINGMTDSETAELTRVMSVSGETLDLSDIDGIKADKHSTGGVGDKTTLIIAPVAAACGAKIAKMSGRGLGHTGGTVDKLLSIPGFSVSISVEKFKKQVNDYGIALIRQLDNLVPADKKIYQLRDVTATVDSIPLIASSIMSKKLALGADVIVLDVKYGSGAFMKNKADAEELARLMCEIGEKNERKVSALITDMDVPLGNAIGNSLEVIESIEVLKGGGPEDLRNVSIELAGKILELCGLGGFDECCDMAREAIDSGQALEKFYEWIRLQCGAEDFEMKLKKAKYEIGIRSEKSGRIVKMDVEKCGIASVILGAGRESIDDEIDYSAGIILRKKTGDFVNVGDTIAVFCSDDENKIKLAKEKFISALTIEG